MIPRRAVPFLTLAALSCGESTQPATRDLELELCGNFTWAAYQNEGAAWTHIASTIGSYTIRVTDRLAIAMARVMPESPHMAIYFVTAEQAESLLACSNPPAAQFRPLTGSVHGLTADHYAEMTLGLLRMPLSASNSDFAITNVRQGALDVLATRLPPPWDHIDRMILRRAQAHASGTIALLDFDGAEAFEPQANTMTWVGPRSHIQINFFTARGNDHVLQSNVVGDPGSGDIPRTATINSLPADRAIAGDVHQLVVSGDNRTVTEYYAQTGNRTVTFGPPLTSPNFTDVATSPNLRVRVDVPSQSAYDGWLSVFFQQDGTMGGGGAHIHVTATREYFGGLPSTWSFTLPDLNGVDGFHDWLGLQPGQPFEWYMFATSRRFSTPQAMGQPGDVVRSANLSGVR